MAYKKNFTCILLRTSDNRSFFTYKRHLKHVTEYFKTFGAEVFLTKAKDVEVLELNELVQGLCNPVFNQNTVEHNIVEKVYPINIKTREETREIAKDIKEYIESQFLNSDIVSLKKIKTKFQKHDLSDSCLSNHLSRVRKGLEDQGMVIQRVGLGKYRITHQNQKNLWQSL